MIETQANRVSASSCAAASVSTDGRTQGGSATATAISNIVNITNNVTDVLVTALPPASAASLLLAGTHAAFGFTTRPRRPRPSCGYAVHHRPTPPTHAPHLPSATATTEKTGKTSTTSKTSSGSKTSTTGSSGKSSSSEKSSSSKSTSSSSKTDGPLGFLNDPKMSVEDKLFKFMCYVADKYDKAIEKKMKEIANKQDGGSSGSTSGAAGSKKKTSGLLGGGTEGGGASAGAAGSGAGGGGGLLGGLLGGAGGAGGLLGGGAGGAGGLLGGLLGGGGGGGGAGLLGGLMNTLCPMAGLGADLLGNTGIQDLVTQVSGPVLAAGATAFGFPEFAPLLAQIGPQLTQGAFSIYNQATAGGSSGTPSGTGASGGTGSSSGAGSSSGSGTTKKSSGSSGSSSGSSSSSGAEGDPKIEQKDMLELQRLQDKQKEMFSLVSNMLRSMHDTKMAVINNLRT